MPKVLFLIGNGFDLHLGLQTKYEDFYKYFVDLCPENIIAKEIKSEPATWADLEIALGKYAGSFTVSNVNELYAADLELESELANYLSLQEERITIKKEDEERVANMMRSFVLTFYKELPLIYRTEISKKIERMQSIQYSFIDFNYTNVLDRIVEVTKMHYRKEFAVHVSKNTRYVDSLEMPFHIHGTLQDELILGVNDDSQIGNTNLVQLPVFREFFIKHETNKRFAQNKEEIAKELINQSELIGVYGMSMGESDNNWWGYIGSWLAKSEDKRLIIYEYDDSKRVGRSKRDFLVEDSVRKRFKKRAALQDDIWDKVKDRIHVVFNSFIFDFPNMLNFENIE